MSGRRRPRSLRDDRRGQLLILAAAVIALAFVPMAVAYLQLAHHPDVAAAGEDPASGARTLSSLERSVHEAAIASTGDRSWSDRDAAVDDVRARLASRVSALETARLAEGSAFEIEYNQSAAADWATANCPGGPNRQFGPCEARRGVVVQDRVGETHVLAVAFDVTVTSADGVTHLTDVVRSR